MLFEPSELSTQNARIMVVGIGGAGGNALNRMIEDNHTGVEFVAINTDAQALEANNSQLKLQIGKELTKGLGAGANSEVGHRAAEESKEAIAKLVSEADMVFITAGMGGGTGTGAAPVAAKIARECGALTVGVVTKPFSFEGPKRINRALAGIKELKTYCDTTLVIPNETLLSITDPGTSVVESFKIADSILHQATRGISDLINVPGLINLDFADVRTIMENMGDAIMGTGIAHGEERAILAAQQAINSPLLHDVCIRGAVGLLVNITGPENMTIHELSDASNIIYEEAGDGANIILGCVIDKNMTDEFRVTVIATGINKDMALNEEKEQPFFRQDVKEPIVYASDTENDFESALPTYQQKRQNQDSPQYLNAKEDKDDEIVQMPVFGDDDLDVPTFIRNRRVQQTR